MRGVLNELRRQLLLLLRLRLPPWRLRLGLLLLLPRLLLLLLRRGACCVLLDAHGRGASTIRLRAASKGAHRWCRWVRVLWLCGCCCCSCYPAL